MPQENLGVGFSCSTVSADSLPKCAGGRRIEYNFLVTCCEKVTPRKQLLAVTRTYETSTENSLTEILELERASTDRNGIMYSIQTLSAQPQLHTYTRAR